MDQESSLYVVVGYRRNADLSLVISTPDECANVKALGFCARAVTPRKASEDKHPIRTTSMTNFSRVRYDVASIT